MITYIETNFVLELAYRQEEASACDALLSFGKRIDLRIPAVSLCEPYFQHLGLVERTAKALEPTKTLLAEIGRARRFSDRAMDMSDSLTLLFGNWNDLNKEHLDAALKLISEAAFIIPLTPQVIELAHDFQRRYGLKPLDSMVMSSVVSDFQVHQPSRPKMFVTRDPKMVRDHDVKAQLSKQSCKVIYKFSDAEKYIKSQV